jgi:hypothetical protein
MPPDPRCPGCGMLPHKGECIGGSMSEKEEDLIVRLREHAEEFPGSKCHKRCCEAADEIERLRDALATLRQDGDMLK